MSYPYFSSHLRILIVDDDPAILEVMGDLLRVDGHLVETATDGQAALDLFTPDRFDVVLTDRAMPEMDGEKLAEAVKTISPSTPVIMVTGFAPSLPSASIDAVIRKPFTRASLADAINRTYPIG